MNHSYMTNSSKKPITFKEAIEKALHTPKISRKQMLEILRQERELKKKKPR